MYVHHAEAAEIAVFRAERAVGDGHILDEFRAERLERSEVALAVALRALILLDVVHQDLEPAIDSAVIQVEAEAADLERLAAAFVLAGIDSGIELLQHLVIAGKERFSENFRIPKINNRLDGSRGDYNALAVSMKRLKSYLKILNASVRNGYVAPDAFKLRGGNYDAVSARSHSCNSEATGHISTR